MVRIASLLTLLALAAPSAAQPPAVSVRGLEESVEQLDAALDVKRAYVKAAEVGVAAAKSKFNLLANGNFAQAERNQAKFELEAAEALLDIRKAEMREVEVRLNQVKKRLAEAKPDTGPKPILPKKPPNPATGAKASAEEAPKALEDKFRKALEDKFRVVVELQIVRGRVEQRKAVHTAAQTELARVKKLAEAGIVAQSDFLQAQQAATIAELDLLLAQTELQVLEVKLKAPRPPAVAIPEPRPR